jgi:hypothetical protein
MTKERKSWVEKIAEWSKNIDIVMIAVGFGIYVIFNKTFGAIIVIGSALTMVPAEMIERWSKKRKTKGG